MCRAFRMNQRLRGWLFAPILVSVFAILNGCATNRSSEALLYKRTSTSDAQYEIQKSPDSRRVSLNPIWVKKGPLKLTIDEIRPGYIHTDVLGEGRSNNFTPFKGKGNNSSTGVQAVESEAKKAWASDEHEFLSSRELWLIKVATCIRDSDPLGLASKKIVAASNVKLNAMSYAAVPLSDSESTMVLPDSDCDYLIEFRLYEVDGIAYKRALVRLEPGIAGLAKSAWSTITGLFKTIVGPTLFDTDDTGALLLEQLLLSINAKLEFKGRTYVVRSDKYNSDVNSYLLYDVVKSDGHRDGDKRCADVPFSAENPESYRKAQDKLFQNCEKLHLNDNNAEFYTFIRFQIKKFETP